MSKIWSSPPHIRDAELVLYYQDLFIIFIVDVLDCCNKKRLCPVSILSTDSVRALLIIHHLKIQDQKVTDIYWTNLDHSLGSGDHCSVVIDVGGVVDGDGVVDREYTTASSTDQLISIDR